MSIQRDLENLKNEEAIARDWAANAVEKKSVYNNLFQKTNAYLYTHK